MTRAWRLWRARVWSRRRDKLELMLAAFRLYKHGRYPNKAECVLESKLDRAKYKQTVYEALARRVPRATANFNEDKLGQ